VISTETIAQQSGHRVIVHPSFMTTPAFFLAIASSVSAIFLAGCATRTLPRPADTAPGATAPAPLQKVTVIKHLADTHWTVVELGGEALPEVNPTAPDWPPLSLEFGRDGQSVTGHGGVNRFAGRYTQGDNDLSFGPLAMTRRAGPSGLMALEHRFTRALTCVTHWRQEGNRLVLLDKSGAMVAILGRATVRVPAATAPATRPGVPLQ